MASSRPFSARTRAARSRPNLAVPLARGLAPPPGGSSSVSRRLNTGVRRRLTEASFGGQAWEVVCQNDGVDRGPRDADKRLLLGRLQLPQ